MKSLISLMLIMICSVNLWANAAAPSQGGQTLTEPSGIKNIDIIKEDLNIDLTQLGDETVAFRDRFINVEAIYQVENPSDLEKLELVFVIVSNAKNFQFFLNEKEISFEMIDNKEFAARGSWNKPNQTPFENRELMYNPNNRNLKSAKFTLNLPKGEHTLKAKYKAEPTVYKDVGIMNGWQFAYSLAPARDWKSFGGLELKIKIPQDWKFFSNLKLEQNGENLTGNFKEIPADFLAVTTQAPIPSDYKLWNQIMSNLFLTSLFGIPLLMTILAFWKGYSWKNGWAFGIVLGVAWSLFVGTMGFLSESIPKAMIPEGQYATYGYGDISNTFFIVLLMPITLVIGIILWILSIWLARRLRKG